MGDRKVWLGAAVLLVVALSSGAALVGATGFTGATDSTGATGLTGVAGFTGGAGFAGAAELAGVAGLVQSAGADPPEYGPAKGTLVIVGGGSLESTGIPEKFIALAGGPEAKLLVVPTAGGNKNPDGTIRIYKEADVIAPWIRRGLKNVRMLHTHDPKVADTEAFVKDLREANAVWFDGGRQWNIVDSYMNTLTYREFHNVLERGGVIGGSSAGATIQGDYLVRGAVAGAQIMMTPEPEHERGFNFLRRSAIDQHINTRNRWDDLIPVIQKYPTLLGIGLSEGTAIIVTGDRFEVTGKWKVAVHDKTRLHQPWEKSYFVLSAGDIYNMRSRRLEKLGTGSPPQQPQR
jgi:cyanophycinase